jgi:hypothetical protein
VATGTWLDFCLLPFLFAPSYTHRHRCRGAHARGGFWDNFSIPHFHFVWDILKTYSRPHKSASCSHVCQICTPHPRNGHLRVQSWPGWPAVRRVPYTHVPYTCTPTVTLHPRTLHLHPYGYPTPTYPTPAALRLPYTHVPYTCAPTVTLHPRTLHLRPYGYPTPTITTLRTLYRNPVKVL